VADVPESRSATGPHVCPWWLIWTFDNPLRRVFHKPERLLAGLVKPGDHCLDLGCGIGYFTIPMATMVGDSGAVTAVDVQPQMLEGVRRRAQRAGLESRVRLHLATGPGLDVHDPVDFALAFWMLHEVPDQSAFLQGVFAALEPGGRFLLVEPKGHVTRAAFEESVARAARIGLRQAAIPPVSFSRAVLLSRP
jgi:ubiquinone/menaquinone biosynthesis C-methylase UbiE